MATRPCLHRAKLTLARRRLAGAGQPGGEGLPGGDPQATAVEPRAAAIDRGVGR